MNGSFGSGAGFLQGSPQQWADQLAQLTLSTGMSVYILSVATADDLRRFAEEVAPATRELVADARGWPDQDTPASPFALEPPAPLTARPTPQAAERLSDERVWDESTRPAGPVPDPSRTYTVREQATGQHLIDVTTRCAPSWPSCATSSRRSPPAPRTRPPCARSSTA